MFGSAIDSGLAQQCAAVGALSAVARDRLVNHLEALNTKMLGYPEADEGILSRDDIADVVQAHLEEMEPGWAAQEPEGVAQVSRQTAVSLEFFLTSARKFFFRNIFLFHDMREGPLPEAWRRLAGEGELDCLAAWLLGCSTAHATCMRVLVTAILPAFLGGC